MNPLRLLSRPALGIAIGAAVAAGLALADPSLAAAVKLADANLIAVKIGGVAMAVWYVAAHLQAR